MILTKRKLEIKHRIYNASLTHGNKKTGEKFFLKSLKKIQKITKKKHSKIFLLALKNAMPILKIDKQRIKKKKRKRILEIPTFIPNNSLRINLAFKRIIQNSNKRSESTNFFIKFSNEILETAAALKTLTINQKTDFHKQAMLKKNLFFRYRWQKR